MAALEEMNEAEEEEREVEEVEDLLEYYLQRAAATQSEAERLLDGARDLEESIGVSLSARRFEVCLPLPTFCPSPMSILTRRVAVLQISSRIYQAPLHNCPSGIGFLFQWKAEIT